MGVLGAMERSEWVQLLPGAPPVWIKKNGAGEGDQQGLDSISVLSPPRRPLRVLSKAPSSAQMCHPRSQPQIAELTPEAEV